MELNKGKSKTSGFQNIDLSIDLEELANLKKVSDIDNQINVLFEKFQICSANEPHVKEIAELWANLAAIQQLNAPDRFSFKNEIKDWQTFVRRKLEKKNNLLLVVLSPENCEVKGFLYLQSVTLPSSDFILKGVIEDLYIKPQHRKKGIATCLLDVSCDWALSQNIKKIDLICLTRPKDLLDFYLSYLKEFKKEINLDLITL